MVGVDIWPLRLEELKKGEESGWWEAVDVYGCV
jgi:hypothetical protein